MCLGFLKRVIDSSCSTTREIALLALLGSFSLSDLSFSGLSFPGLFGLLDAEDWGRYGCAWRLIHSKLPHNAW